MLILFVKLFAIFAHNSIKHKRKYTGEPYWHHLREVAETVRDVGGNKHQIAAAWLHDTVEDTWVTIGMIRFLFGSRVGILVDGLTDVSKPSDGNRAKRKCLDRAWLAEQSSECKTIKLADCLSNGYSIIEHDPKFAKVYIGEIELLMRHLTEGESSLYDAVKRMIECYYNKNA